MGIYKTLAKQRDKVSPSLCFDITIIPRTPRDTAKLFVQFAQISNTRYSGCQVAKPQDIGGATEFGDFGTLSATRKNLPNFCPKTPSLKRHEIFYTLKSSFLHHFEALPSSCFIVRVRYFL